MRIAKYALMALVLMTAGGMTALGQDNTAPAAPGSGGPPRHGDHMMAGGGPHGLWWDNQKVATELALTADQKTKLDNIMQQNRIALIDQHATVEKEQATLDPLMSADNPDEAKISSQIDRVAQARAELEKAHAKMLLQMRQVLTADQWSKLKSMHGGMAMGMHGMGPHGPGAAPPAPPQ